jgi:hypothetical protein
VKLNLWCILQVVELDFQYPSEGLHQRYGAGYRITSCAATPDQAAFILSMTKKPKMKPMDETLLTSDFPSKHIKVHLHVLLTLDDRSKSHYTSMLTQCLLGLHA